MGNNGIKEKNKQKYEGKVFVSNQGCKYIIKKYNNAKNVEIEFLDTHNVKTIKLAAIYTGKVKNPYYPSVCSVGYIGSFEGKINNNGKTIKEYDTWSSIIKRCYDKNTQNKKGNETYEGCTVCEEWHNFTNFHNWIINEPNYKKWKNNKQWCIDKDIISKGNKEYNPKKCCLLPNSLNVIFTNRKNFRGKYMVGVSYHKTKKKYVASISMKGINKDIGSYAKEQEAFEAYKKAKESYIKEIAEEEYKKGNITKKCYNAMKRYKVEQDD